MSKPMSDPAWMAVDKIIAAQEFARQLITPLYQSHESPTTWERKRLREVEIIFIAGWDAKDAHHDKA